MGEESSFRRDWPQEVLGRLRTQNEATRVFHGRGGVHEGPTDLTLEWYPPVLLAISYSEESKKDFLRDQDAYLNHDEVKVLVLQDRSLQGRPSWEVLKGEVPEEHEIMENGVRYLVRFLGRQSPGLFLASSEARRWIKENSSGLKVLNLFAFTGAFGVCALLGGASEVVQVDMKRGPLQEAKRNLLLNEVTKGKVDYWCHDILKSKAKIGRRGPWDLIVLDPPTYQKGAWSLHKDLPKIVSRLNEWTRVGSRVLFCVHDPSTTTEIATEMMAEAVGWSYESRLPQPKGFEEKDMNSALKILVFSRKS